MDTVTDNQNNTSSEEANSARDQLHELKAFMNQRILGQPNLVTKMLVTLLADGHLLVEGAPGLAKTKAVKTLAQALQGDFQRIQFTPDLLPADLTGTDIYRPQDGSFEFQPGPLFHHIILADEINRAPAKVQSALLESMAERQITVGGTSYSLPELFFVMATQNPIEQEGTYPLPEAQLDRFLLKVDIDYPELSSERLIMLQARAEAQGDKQVMELPQVLPLPQDIIFDARRQVLDIHMAQSVEDYIVHLVQTSRNAKTYSQSLDQWILYGASPRATLAFDRCSRALAWLDDRDYVSPEDVQQLAHEILRHRILLSFQAEADGVTIDQVIDELLTHVPVA